MQDPPESLETCDEAAHVQGLFVRYQLELRGLLLAILADSSAVDDVLQETFLTVTRKHLAFDPKNNEPIANLFISMLRRLGLEVDQFASLSDTLRGLELR